MFMLVSAYICMSHSCVVVVMGVEVAFTMVLMHMEVNAITAHTPKYI